MGKYCHTLSNNADLISTKYVTLSKYHLSGYTEHHIRVNLTCIFYTLYSYTCPFIYISLTYKMAIVSKLKPLSISQYLGLGNLKKIFDGYNQKNRTRDILKTLHFMEPVSINTPNLIFLSLKVCFFGELKV